MLILIVVNVVCLNYVHIVDMQNCSSNEATSSRIQPQPIVDRTEQKRERERKRYAEMDTNSKNELLARKHVAYQRKRLLAGK